MAALLFSNLLTEYRAAPVKELRNRSKQKDPVAQLLIQVAVFGRSVDAILMGLTLFFAALTVALAANIWGTFFAVLFIVLFLFVIFVWPNNPDRVSRYIARQIAPHFASLLSVLLPVSIRVGRIINRYRPVTIHTGLYDKGDLLELIEKQKVVPGNQIEQAELEVAKHALTFGAKIVKDYMTPRRVIRFVAGDDPIGPVLINELHESGFSRFPVSGENDDSLIGTLYLKDLVAHKHGGIVKNAMKSQVFYVNEDSSLESVLGAFLHTKHHLFVVVNEFEEIVGLITIEDVLEQIIGHKIVDEFDQYEDLRAVAKQNGRKQAKGHERAVGSNSSETKQKVVE